METIKTAEDFVRRCRRDDGGYAPSPDPAYPGFSDTRLSDLAAVTYAAVLARTFGWDMQDPDRSVEYIRERQQPDGSYAHQVGEMDPGEDLAILYNTTQVVVALWAFGQKPEIDPAGVMSRFFDDGAFRRLPWYTTSFFPLFYRALDRPFPNEYRVAIEEWMIGAQAEDGYLGDHIASTFHMAHFFRLLGRPTPRAREMVRRTLRDQKPDGGWNIRASDWDVHACFDAVFVLRQLGDNSADIRSSLYRAASWSAGCRGEDGGFGHYPGWHSDMDAVYFQLGTLCQAGAVTFNPPSAGEAAVLGWGHAMPQERDLSASSSVA
ncbi:MAG TPA: prenyltransferase/squalene oxidase repeat-containing protein [Armatimonadota bacterium]|nr:prenyltransferase/squalene oxidase repeat-containing protein [Armatimonadota bacterium]